MEEKLFYSAPLMELLEMESSGSTPLITSGPKQGIGIGFGGWD